MLVQAERVPGCSGVVMQLDQKNSLPGMYLVKPGDEWEKTGLQMLVSPNSEGVVQFMALNDSVEVARLPAGLVVSDGAAEVRGRD